ILFFDEGLDSATASTAGNYLISGNTVVTATAVPPLYNSVQIKLATPLVPSTVYSVAVNNVTDCRGNAIAGNRQAQLGIAQGVVVNDVVINEILFNPKPNGADYVELYNNSKKIIDLNKLYLANRNGNGVISSLSRISDVPFFVFPSSYVVVTEDPLNLSLNYLVKDADAVLTVSSLASYPDDQGTVVLVDVNNIIADEVAYDDDWHFALIADKEGVALERLDFNAASQNKGNWHSAATTAGYGTPGYKNSQTIGTANASATIEIVTKVFSPDNDGIDDVAAICYNISESGYLANIIIFDINGRRIKHLVKNAIPGLRGCWNWDGLDEKNQKLPIGNYVIYAELFNLKGAKEQFKKTITLARRF
ncbi:MAG: lamin tail domain-containing protein, partial [Bacteroidota bacterium]